MRFTKPFVPSWMHGHAAGRLLAPIIALSLATISTAIYLSPAGPHSRGGAQRAGAATVASGSGTPHSSGSSSPSARPAPTKPPPSPAPASTIQRPPQTRTQAQTQTRTQTQLVRTKTTVTASPSVHAAQCSDFAWQQDAQATYVANLSDPYGLDGGAGPNNGDGLACSQLPVDPSRSASVAVDAFVAPAPAQKAALVDPARDYFGIAEDGLPGDTPLLNSVAATAGKAPSALEWFSYWDSDYDSAKVAQSWSRDALPVITWMSEPSNSTAPNASSYSLANIANGSFDAYLLKYAGSVLQSGLPVAIRFDHEMNGNWYPWSAGLPANQPKDPSQPNLYVQAWRHIWNIFDSVGANADVIWLWTPVRIDTLSPHSQVSGSKYQTALDEDYPGDDFVDWVGTSAYQYKPSDGWSFSTTFTKTLSGLKALTSKPIFIAETGATEAVDSTDYAAQKAQWTTQTLASLVADPSVVGFCWFNNSVDDVHKVDGDPIQTDWQFTSSPEATSAFRAGVSDGRYSSGVMPDGTGG